MAENRDEIIILTNIGEVEVMLEEHTIKYINLFLYGNINERR